MKELSEWPQLKRILDRRLIRALNHPVREHILAVLNERVASAREIGEEIGADVSSFYHHVEELERLDCVERVETRRCRGAREHFFRAKRALFFDDAAWQDIPPTLKADAIVNCVQGILDDVVAAIEAESLGSRDDTHVSRVPATLDARGWHEATDLMSQTLERLSEIKDASAERLVKEGNERISATMAILAFETAPTRQAKATTEQAR